MKYIFIPALACMMTLSGSISAQVITGAKAQQIVKGAREVITRPGRPAPDYVAFQQPQAISADDFATWFSKQFAGAQVLELEEYERNYDNAGFMHVRFMQKHQGIEVAGGRVYAHYQRGKLVSFNGDLVQVTGSATPSLSEALALQKALDAVNALTYKWQLPEEEADIRNTTGNPDATYYPQGQLVYLSPTASGSQTPRLAWKFDIYAHQPVSRTLVFVDAATGEILYQNPLLYDADVVGTAATVYSGAQSITADSFGGSYRLRETGRGNGIQTYDMNEGTSYGSAVDFTDADNYWNNTNAQLDEYATDAHWGAEKTYDYFFQEHSRNSIDDNGFTLRSYLHYDVGYANAFWDGQRMTYGDGGGGLNPLVALDIAGHEITHGLTTFTADLVYQNESGALNESFSDIFGVSIEWYAKPATANWLMGEDIGSVIRSMSNPNAYGDPDTYGGTNWYVGTADNGGVHTNSGVQNYWYYLLVNGGTGVNDLGQSYSVTALGLQDAAAIAFRNLTVYLGPNSNYADARFYSILAATDLFGACSPQVIATTNAWHAVGVGGPFNPTVTADFSADFTSGCQAPLTVSFTNLSQTAGSFVWDFGDGGSSTALNPSHTYTAPGTYTVQLQADGGACGNDNEVKTAYISIDPGNPCVAVMPASGTGNTQTSCQGTLYDAGGPGADYPDNTTGTITIAPAGATQVTLYFNSFSYENNFDYLYIYDGPTTASPLIGQYTGAALPNSGTITSTGASITLRHTSDQNVTASGFDLEWACLIPNTPPIAQFTANLLESCNGEFHFADQSLMAPTSWLWDFGDGNTSTQQNPSHIYAAEGTYTVTLTATNAFGSDTEVETAYVVVDYPDAPAVTDAGRCDPGTVTLTAAGTGELRWFDAPTGGTQVNTGTSYTTPALSSTTTYYVEEAFGLTPGYVGPTDNTFGTGGNFTGDQHLVFDCYKPVTLVSVLVYAQGAGNRTIELRSATGSVLQSAIVNVPNGTSRVTLNFDVPVGTNLQLGTATGSTPNLYRNNAGPTYPYSLSGVIDITTSSAGNSYYYSFYDWEIQEPICISERAPVTAAIATAPVAGDQSICSGQTATINATGSGTGNIHWYDAPSAGNLLGTGAAFTTPALSSTTTYYVEEELLAGPSQYVGPTTNAIGTGGMFSGNQHLIFDVSVPQVLQSVLVYAGTAGNRTIELRNSSGGVIESATVNIPAGQSRVVLDFDLPVGTGFQLGTAVGSNPDLYRNSAGAVFPYSIPGVITITGSSAGGAYYYHFYDWEVHDPACNTTRTAVTVTVAPSFDATISPQAPLCATDSPVVLSAADAGGTWSGTGVNPTTGAFDPASSGNGSFVITYTIPGTCGDTDDITILVSNGYDATIAPVGILCDGSAPVQIVAVDAGGTWSADCGTCINSTTGMFDPVLSGSGTFTVTSTFGGSCGSTDSEVITVLAQADASIAPVAVLCADGAPVVLSAAEAGGTWSGTGVNAATGEFDPAASGVGTFTVTYTITGTCGDSDQTTVQVDARMDASVAPAGPFCVNHTPVSLNAMMPGGTWSGTGIINSTTGIFDPATAGAGTHTITYALGGNCPDSEDITIVVDNCTDVHVPEAVEFAVYPNPNDGMFRVGVGNTRPLGSVRIAITDLQGRVVATREFNTVQQRHLELFDLSGQADGTYVVVIELGTEIIRTRVVKQ